MGNALDSVGQWLTQLSVLGQVGVLLALLLPLGGVAAFLLVGVIDFCGGRIRGARIRRKRARKAANQQIIVPESAAGCAAPPGVGAGVGLYAAQGSAAGHSANRRRHGENGRQRVELRQIMPEDNKDGNER